MAFSNSVSPEIIWGLGGPEEDHQLHHCCWTGRVSEREEEDSDVKFMQKYWEVIIVCVFFTLMNQNPHKFFDRVSYPQTIGCEYGQNLSMKTDICLNNINLELQTFLIHVSPDTTCIFTP